jgi:hypothetical protein
MASLNLRPRFEWYAGALVLVPAIGHDQRRFWLWQGDAHGLPSSKLRQQSSSVPLPGRVSNLVRCTRPDFPSRVGVNGRYRARSPRLMKRTPAGTSPGLDIVVKVEIAEATSDIPPLMGFPYPNPNLTATQLNEPFHGALHTRRRVSSASRRLGRFAESPLEWRHLVPSSVLSREEVHLCPFPLLCRPGRARSGRVEGGAATPVRATQST